MSEKVEQNQNQEYMYPDIRSLLPHSSSYALLGEGQLDMMGGTEVLFFTLSKFPTKMISFFKDTPRMTKRIGEKVTDKRW